MSDEARINLIFDPYRISNAEGERIRDVGEELKTFREIALHLRRDPRCETVHPKTYVIETSWEHFRTYRAVRNVHMEVVSPRARIRERFNAQPPEWLTDQLISDCKMLDLRESPIGLINDDWAATVAACIFPGIAEAASLNRCLDRLACAPELPDCWKCEPILEWLTSRFATLASQSIQSPDIVCELRDALRSVDSPVMLARDWIRRRSLLPLLRHDIQKPLSAPELPPESPRNLVVAGYLPQLFPLPDSLHQEVSDIMRRAVQRARLETPDSFEAAALLLNAMWDGVPDELGAWLDVRPRAMTAQVVLHLKKLPGYDASEQTQRLVANYAPPDAVSTWFGLADDFDAWVTAYATYASRIFFRRELPSIDADPATPFGRWLKDNSAVFFNHPERGYRRVAKVVQEALQNRRAVLVVLMDALAIQLTEIATGYLTDAIGTHPSRANFFFAPLPTITAVCKEAILTGQLPSECKGNLATSLLRSYGLESEQLRLAANWQDAERLQFNSQTRLVVYRDNRIDDQLKTAGTYKVLFEECPAVLSRIARLVERWVRDLQHLHGSPPLVLLTADHGFTFGPPPNPDAHSQTKVTGAHRCIELTGRADDSDLADESLTFIDKAVFHLHNSYLAARGRYFGRGTTSGWALSHGGLLPEEVIVPLVEWFGDEVPVHWPEFSFPDGASRDRDHWLLTVVLHNAHAVPLFGISIRLSVSGESHTASQFVSRLGPNEVNRFIVQLPSGIVREGEFVPISVTMSQSSTERGTATAQERVREFPVPKAKQFVIRTVEQAAFEEMF